MLNIPFLPEAIRSIRPSPFIFDDVVDQLNFFITSLLLLFCAVLVGAKQNIGSPIQCWTPKEFERGWEEYTEDYCFVESTYFIPLNTGLGHDRPPIGTTRDGARVVNYYQWVPIILVVQAAFFYLPHFLWKISCWHSGINVQAVLQRASEARNSSEDKNYDRIKTLAHYVEDSLGLTRALRNRSACSESFCRLNCGVYLCMTYLSIKVLYLTNLICQLLIMEQFFEASEEFEYPTPHYFWGFQVIMDLSRGNRWHTTGHFPRVTMCDFFIRRLGNIQHYSVQCVLMINMFNEKIYLVIWCWCAVLTLITAVNLVYWVFITVVPSKQVEFVHKYLRISQENPESKIVDVNTVRRFCTNALQHDGVILLRFVSLHSGDMIALELTSMLWKDYLTRVLGLPCVLEKSKGTISAWGSETVVTDEGAARLDGSTGHPLFTLTRKDQITTDLMTNSPLMNDGLVEELQEDSGDRAVKKQAAIRKGILTHKKVDADRNERGE